MDDDVDYGECADCMQDMTGPACDACSGCISCCFRRRCEKAPATFECEECRLEKDGSAICRACLECLDCCDVKGEVCANCECHLEVSVPGEKFCEECGRLWCEGGGVGGSGDMCVCCEKELGFEEEECDEPRKKAKVE